MMAFGKYVDGVDMSVLERLHECRRIEVHRYIGDEGEV